MLSEPLLLLILGESYGGAANVFSLAVGAYVLAAVNAPLAAFLQGSGHSKWVALFLAVLLVGSLVLVLGGALLRGATGAAGAVFLTQVAIMIGLVNKTHSLNKQEVAHWWGDIVAWDLAKFDAQKNVDSSANRLMKGLWLGVASPIFMSVLCPRRLRPTILRAFGSRIGQRVVIKQRVRIHWPWNLSLGDDVWLGEGVWMLNLERVEVGNQTCISQAVTICSGSHDRFSSDFAYKNCPVIVEDHVWVALGASVLAGVTIGRGAVIGAGAVVSQDVAAATLVRSPS